MKINKSQSIMRQASMALALFSCSFIPSVQADTHTINGDVSICTIMNDSCQLAQSYGMEIMPVEMLRTYMALEDSVVLDVNGGIWMSGNATLNVTDGESLKFIARGGNGQVWFLEGAEVNVGVGSSFIVDAKGHTEIEASSVIAGDSSSRILIESDYQITVEGNINSGGEYVALLSKQWLNVTGVMQPFAKTILASNYRDNGWSYDSWYNAGNVAPLTVNDGNSPYVQDSSSDTMKISGMIIQMVANDEFHAVAGGDLKLNSGGVLSLYNKKTNIDATGWFHHYGRLVAHYPINGYPNAPDININADRWNMSSNSALGGTVDELNANVESQITFIGSTALAVDNVDIASRHVSFYKNSVEFTSLKDSSTFALVTDTLSLTSDTSGHGELRLVNFGADRDANFYSTLTRRNNVQVAMKNLVDNGGNITLETTDSYPEVPSNGYEGADMTLLFGDSLSASAVRSVTSTESKEFPISANIYSRGIDDSISFYDNLDLFGTSNTVETISGSGFASNFGPYFVFDSSRGRFYVESSDL